MARGELQRELLKPREGGPISGLAFRPHSSTLTVASLDGSVTDWETARSRRPFQRVGPSARNRPRAVSYSHDGRWLAAPFANGEVRLWEADGDGPGKVLNGWGQSAVAVTFSPDGRHLAAAHVNTGIDVFDVASGKRLQAISAPGPGFSKVLYSADGRVLLSTTPDSTIPMWDPSTGRRLLTALTLDASSNWVATAPDGRFDGSPEGQRIIQWRLGDRLFRPGPVLCVLLPARAPAPGPARGPEE